jgi:hypothetical protein
MQVVVFPLLQKLPQDARRPLSAWAAGHSEEKHENPFVSIEEE